jgi:hypothetical protein
MLLRRQVLCHSCMGYSYTSKELVSGCVIEGTNHRVSYYSQNQMLPWYATVIIVL